MLSLTFANALLSFPFKVTEYFLVLTLTLYVCALAVIFGVALDTTTFAVLFDVRYMSSPANVIVAVYVLGTKVFPIVSDAFP